MMFSLWMFLFNWIILMVILQTMGWFLENPNHGYFYNQHSHRLVHTCRKSPPLNLFVFVIAVKWKAINSYWLHKFYKENYMKNDNIIVSQSFYIFSVLAKNNAHIFEIQECIPVGWVPAVHWPSRGGGVQPRRIFFGKKKLKKKFGGNPPPSPLKISDTPPKIFSDTPLPPENFRHPPEISDPPRKFQTPPRKFQTPPEKFQTPPGPGHLPPPPRGQTHACKLITLAQLRCGR